VSGAQERVAGAGRRLEDVSTLALSFLPSLGKIEVIILLQQVEAQDAAPFLVCSDNFRRYEKASG
jgi:hypothetical protein